MYQSFPSEVRPQTTDQPYYIWFAGDGRNRIPSAYVSGRKLVAGRFRASRCDHQQVRRDFRPATEEGGYRPRNSVLKTEGARAGMTILRIVIPLLGPLVGA